MLKNNFLPDLHCCGGKTRTSIPAAAPLEVDNHIMTKLNNRTCT